MIFSKRKYRILDILNPLNIFLFSYLLFLGIAPLINNYFLDNFFNYNLETLQVIYLFPFIFILFFVSTQILIGNFKLYHRRIEFLEFEKLLNVNNLATWFQLFGIFGFLGLFLSAGQVPLLAENSEEFRIEAAKGKGEFILLFTAFIYVGSIYKTMCLNFYGKNLFFRSFLMLFLSFIVILFNGWRSPAFYLFIVCYLSFQLNNPEYLSRRRISFIYIVIIVIIFPVVSYIGLLRGGFAIDNFSQLTINMFHLVNVNVNNLDVIVKLFRYNDLFLGRSFLNDFLVAIPGFQSEFTGVTMKKLAGLDFVGETMTVTLPGEGYINFGFFGTLIYASVLGGTISFLNEYLRFKNTIFSKFYFVILLVFCFRVVTGGIMPIITFTIVPILMVNSLFLVLLRRKK